MDSASNRLVYDIKCQNFKHFILQIRQFETLPTKVILIVSYLCAEMGSFEQQNKEM